MNKEIKDRILYSEKFEWRKLKPFQPENLKDMEKESFEKLKNSIKTNDFIATFDVWCENEDNYWILDGHHRKYALEAVEKEGYLVPDKFQCDFIECKDAQDACYVIAAKASSHAKMNELGFSEWATKFDLDFQRLIDTVDIPNFDLEKIWNENKIEVLEPQSDENDSPDLQIEATNKIGDIWILGNHRLICGDSNDTDSLDRLMNGEKANMVFTDPPYNADYSSRVDKDRRKPWGGILNDNMSDVDFDHFLSEVMNSLVCNIKDGASVYCCIDWKRYPQVATAFNKAFTHKSSIIWDKKHFGLGTYYRTQYEMVLFGVYGEKMLVWNAGSDEKDVWSLSREVTSDYVHPTQKPIELVERAIKNSSNFGDVVLDLFAGSGSTLIACEKTNRKCYTSELAPNYCDVVIKRWQKYTGKKAVHEGSKKTFDEMSPLV